MEKKDLKNFLGSHSVWCFLGCVVCLFIFVCVVVVCGRMARQTHWWLGCFVPWILVRNCAGCPVTRTADKPDKNRPGCLVFATLIKIEQLIKSWNHSSFRPLIWWSPLHLEMQSLNHYCVTQLKLDTVEKLSSSIFCCLLVRHRCHPTKSLLFPIYTGIQALCWPNTIYKGIKALFWVTHSILGLVQIYLPYL